MPAGNPVSQLFGWFQGRSDRFSDSVLAQPLIATAPKSNNSSNAGRSLAANTVMTRKD